MRGVILKRVKFGAAQLGRKLGKQESLEMLIDTSELPGAAWRRLDQRTWRTGAIENEDEESQRARDVKSITAWRSFENDEFSWSVWLEVVPFASSGDAVLAAPKFAERLLRNTNSRVKVTEERLVSDGPLPGVDKSIKFEQLTFGNKGAGSAKYVAGTVQQILFALGTAKQDEIIGWDEVDELAILQASKIRKCLEDAGESRE